MSYARAMSHYVMTGDSTYRPTPQEPTKHDQVDLPTNVISYTGFLAQSEFRKMADQWYEDTIDISSLTEMFSHPAYLRVIGTGERAVPLIMREMENNPSYWFAALEAITGDNPVPTESQGRLPEMTEAWLKWGRERGYD